MQATAFVLIGGRVEGEQLRGGSVASRRGDRRPARDRILLGDYDDELQKVAWGWLGLILGYWLSLGRYVGPEVRIVRPSGACDPAKAILLEQANRLLDHAVVARIDSCLRLYGELPRRSRHPALPR